MNPARKPERRLVRITFKDPTEFDTRFGDEGDPVECTTVGWVIGSDRSVLKLAWIIDDCVEGDYTGLVIPKGCVTAIKKVGSK